MRYVLTCVIDLILANIWNILLLVLQKKTLLLQLQITQAYLIVLIFYYILEKKSIRITSILTYINSWMNNFVKRCTTHLAFLWFNNNFNITKILILVTYPRKYVGIWQHTLESDVSTSTLLSRGIAYSSIGSAMFSERV